MTKIKKRSKKSKKKNKEKERKGKEKYAVKGKHEDYKNCLQASQSDNEIHYLTNMKLM